MCLGKALATRNPTSPQPLIKTRACLKRRLAAPKKDVVTAEASLAK
jgi:hypothetical protein